MALHHSLRYGIALWNYLALIITTALLFNLSHEKPASIALAETTSLQPASDVPASFRVAFILAGSARSFVEPLVHRYIRANLIDSFCPYDNGKCRYDVFARVSTSDNNHFGKRDSKGVPQKGTNEHKQKILDTIESIRPDKHVGSLYTKYFEIGGPEELEEMLDGETFRRRMYRHLDSRRYSMYFNRWKAYELMLGVEQEQGFKYDWVVHCRLDMSWGAPILPIQYWTNQLIYTPDQWYSDVPDTFAIMKRKVSDIFFDLDKMVDEHVYCAGGPDFDPKTLTVEYLTSQSVGFTVEQAHEIIKKEDCLIRFPHYIVMLDKQFNITWTMAGASEFLTKRKLSHNGISIAAKTMEMAPFFAFVVRNLSNNMCYYLKIGHFIPWERTRKSVNAAIYPACELFSIDVFREVNNPKHFSICQYYPKIKGESTCFDNKAVTDYNFMPFRLRFRGKCVMASTYIGERRTPSLSLNTSDCINYYRNHNMEKYHDRQLFSFYPLVTHPQHISVYDNFNFKRHCLTAVPSPGSAAENSTRVRVEMVPCVYSLSNKKELNNQLFEVVNPIRSEDSFKVNTKLGKAEDSNMYDRDRQLGVISYARFRWKSPWRVMFCLYVQQNAGDISGDKSGLILIPCAESFSNSDTSSSSSKSAFFSSSRDAADFFSSTNSGSNKRKDGHVFMLERALVNGEPYKSGITVGQYPLVI